MYIFLLVLWGRLLCWQGVVDMVLLGGVFRCVVDGVVMSFMGGLVAYHMTRLMLVVYHMTRLITFSVGVLATFYMPGLVSACFFSPLPLWGGHHWVNGVCVVV